MKESANHRRGEERRRNRQQRYAVQEAEARIPAAEPEDFPETDLQAVRDQLNDALNSLKPAEREILLSRYFENRDFTAIAEAQGSSPDAVRMRCQRALERLAARLRRRGLTAGSLTLTTALTAQWSRPTPEHLTALVCSAVQSHTSAAAASVFTLMASAKSLTATAVVLLLALIPLHRQHERLRKLERDAAENPPFAPPGFAQGPKPSSTGSLRAQFVPLLKRSDAVAVSLQVPLTAEGLMTSWITGQVRVLLTNGLGVPDKVWQERDAILRLSAAELQNLLKDLETATAPENHKAKAREFLVQIALAAKDPALALETALEERLSDAVIQRIGREWAERDPDAAQAWLEKRRDEGRLSPARFGEDPESQLWSGIARAVATKDPAAAAAWVEASIQTEEAPALLRGLAPAMKDGKWHDRFLDLTDRMSSPEAALQARSYLLAHALEVKSNETDPFRLGRLVLENPRIPAEQREEVLLQALHFRGAEKDDLERLWVFSEAWALTSPERRRDVLLKLLENHNGDRLLSTSGDARIAAHEAAMAEIVRALAPADPGAGKLYMECVNDPFLRESLNRELAPFLQQP